MRYVHTLNGSASPSAVPLSPSWRHTSSRTARSQCLTCCSITGRGKDDRSRLIMRILVTNDDGIHSDGLDICAEIGRALSDDVWVVAPEFDQSGSRIRCRSTIRFACERSASGVLPSRERPPTA